MKDIEKRHLVSNGESFLGFCIVVADDQTKDYKITKEAYYD